MRDVTVVGIDLAKNYFHVHGRNRQGACVLRKRLRRRQLEALAEELASCVVGMEACGGAHYWARVFRTAGHEVRLVRAREVKAYSQRQKNDHNDAEAICEVTLRSKGRSIGIKEPRQQDILCLHRIRERLVRQRTALANEIRGLLMEYGCVMTRGLPHLRRELPSLLDEEPTKLTPSMREMGGKLYEELSRLDEQVGWYDNKIRNHAQQEDVCRRLQTIPGVGIMTASVLVAMLGTGKSYRRGRQFSASVGLVPRQYSTGGQPRLLGITKRGDTYLRKLLIHGARAVLRRVDHRTDPWSRRWKSVKERVGMNKAAVALANKNARVAWAVVTQQEPFHWKKAA